MPRLLNKVAAPALPVSPGGANQSYLNQLTNVLRLFFTRLADIVGTLVGSNGGRFLEVPNAVFFDIGDQPLVAVNVGQAVRFNQTYLSNGVTINGGSDTQITVEFSGVYNIQFTAEVRSGSSSSKIIYLWIMRNDVTVGYSCREYILAGSGGVIEIAWNFIIDIEAGGHIELVWTGSDIGLTLDTVAPTSPHPGIPSAVVSVTFVSALPEIIPTPP